jgi:CubicO group peptidase (beta-lactamase class C family)
MNSRWRRFLVLFIFPIILSGQNIDSEKRLEKYLNAFLTVNNFSGTVLVIKDNKTLIKKSFGFADIEKKVPNNSDTKFRIGSCSKQFTAIAILQLQEKGKLSVHDNINKYLSNIPKGDSITIDMLLTHRSGLHDVYNDSTFEKANTPSLTKDKVLEMIKKSPLDFTPGSKYHYTNSGYFLLGLIIEKLSNQQFDEYMNDNIFKKSKMYSSGVDQNDTSLSYKAKGYTYENDKLTLAPYDNMDASMGNGNLYSTANDIYQYYLSLNDTVLLTQKSLKQLLKPEKNNHTKGITIFKGNYAYGVIVDSLDGHPLITHGGWVYGFRSDITMFLKDRALVVVLSNNEDNVPTLSKGLQAVLFKIPVIYPYKYKERKVEAKSLEKFVGHYGAIEIYKKNDYLFLNDAGSSEEIKLLPETETKFFYEGENDRQIEFGLNDSKKVTKLWLIVSGLKHEFSRKK